MLQLAIGTLGDRITVEDQLTANEQAAVILEDVAPDADRFALVVLPEHRDAPAFGAGLGDALPESARFDEIAALVDIAEGRGVALELPGVLKVTGFEGQGEMFHLGGSDGAIAPVGGSNPA